MSTKVEARKLREALESLNENTPPDPGPIGGMDGLEMATVVLRPPSPALRVINIDFDDRPTAVGCLLDCTDYVDDPSIFPPGYYLCVERHNEKPDRWLPAWEDASG